MSPILQFKRGSAGVAGTVPALRPGEPAFSTNNFDFFVGFDTSVAGNKFFGSHRYWGREDGTTALRLKLVDKNGTNSVNLKAPDTLAGIATYTLPATPVDNHYLKVDAAGNMSWADISTGGSFDAPTISNATFTGISTFSGLIDANAGLDVVGGSNFDNIYVSGIATVNTTLDVNGYSDLTNVNVSVAATIASADINGGTIDGTVIGGSTAAAGTFTHLAYNSSSTSGVSTVGALYLGSEVILSTTETDKLTLSNIEKLDATTIATIESAIQLSPNNFDNINVTGIATFQAIANFGAGINVTAGVSTFAALIDANAGLDVTGLATLNTGLNVTSGVSTFAGLVDANAGLDVFGHSELDDVNVSGASTVNTLNATGNVTLGSDSSDTLTVNAVSTFNGNATFTGTLTGTATTATRATQVDTTTTSTNASYYIPFVANSGSTTGETVRVDGGISYNPSTNTLDVPTLETSAIKHTDGVSAITIDSLGNVGVTTNLTVTGNLTVNGSTTTVETETLLVKDSLIEVGLVESGGALVPPSSDADIDVGLVLHYYSGSAKKAAVYWDDSTSRIAFASEVSESASVLTATTYATILAGGLEINNTCTGGTDTVISCVNGELALSNIVVDAGTF